MGIGSPLELLLKEWQLPNIGEAEQQFRKFIAAFGLKKGWLRTDTYLKLLKECMVIYGPAAFAPVSERRAKLLKVEMDNGETTEENLKSRVAQLVGLTTISSGSWKTLPLVYGKTFPKTPFLKKTEVDGFLTDAMCCDADKRVPACICYENYGN